LRHEKELNNILDLELKRLVSNKRIFENLTHEKPTKRFLDLAHNISKGDSLNRITNDDGMPFNTPADLEKHLTNFYAKLYRKDPEVTGSIEDFLGPDICSHPVVSNSKLTPEQVEELDADLTFEEIHKAMNESNAKSAPGMDGYSGRFIKKFFYIIGRPLFKCFQLCLEEKSLLDMFAIAQIKLIPKKGDTTKVKNWRPISLLSNFYKILSRAVNNRLKKVADRILSRAQKGFTQTRQIHEVIINLTETINQCEKRNIKGAMVCVDQAKAFDSVDHNYMVKVFKFFGFGDRFISWLSTIGTNRKACILLENGNKSVLFNLEKGTAQGDCPSPLLYNFCAQILIFKIELDPGIRRIDLDSEMGMEPAEDPIPVPIVNDNESNFETGKNESFADDSTTCTYFEYDDLNCLKNILIQFSGISGLKCNFDKTSIMRIGNLDGEVDRRILDLGFEIVDNCKLLGFKFSNRDTLADSNAPQLIEKIKNTVRFWTPLNLSVAGKITIAKTLILPLFIYYGTIINFSQHQIDEMEGAIERYVTRGLNIAKDKIYADTGTGGLGLFKLSDFACTLQSYWIKRVLSRAHDNWRRKIIFKSAGNPCFISADNLEWAGPTLAGIVKNFVNFRNQYGTVGNNFMLVPIVNNIFFYYRENRAKLIFDKNFFLGAANNTRISVLTWSCLTFNNNFKSRQELERDGIRLSADQHAKLKCGFRAAKTTFYKENDKGISLLNFFTGIKKGTKRLRTVLTRSKLVKKSAKCPITKFASIAGIETPIDTTITQLNKGWTRSYLCSDFKTFLFKFYHNTLGVNVRVHHYNPDRSPECTFCVKKLILPADRETIQHFFWHCPVSNQSITTLCRELFIFDTNKLGFFTGTDDNGKYHDAINLIYDLIKFILWQHRIRKKLPTQHSMRSDFIFHWNIIIGSNKKIKNAVTNNNYVRRHNGENGGQ
jgi:hypothetical protein